MNIEQMRELANSLERGSPRVLRNALRVAIAEVEALQIKVKTNEETFAAAVNVIITLSKMAPQEDLGAR